ncbi:MAG: type I glyceraldehyde-3-phosphate dehydrogenase [Chloroflexi bacterium]|nr:type I glyceraldehyde-3-phosphate dehydrogenase [Chloroflexota bacterium]MDA0244208.1 type I glyceraldehyde-3-phosphate dehydrogenase [Chloroflexota bacterium]
MTIKIGINGFGRIGRQVYKVIYENYKGILDVEAINDLTAVETNAHMLKYDSTYGRFPGKVEAHDGQIYVDGQVLKSYAEKDPANLPWGDLGVDIVLECTGIFTSKEKAAAHLAGGAKKVIISAPGTNVDGTFCLGVNEELYDPANHHIISNASCTTNCLAPVAKVLHNEFGLNHGLMTTIHAYTNDQRILDLAHKDLRRARAAAVNIIPTSTGAARAIGLVLPELKGKLDGTSLRVPVVTGSVVDLVVALDKKPSVADINAAFKAAGESEGWLGKVLVYTEDPIVSSDIVGDPASATVDGLLTAAMGDMYKIVSWYDNEWGYSNRLADITAFVAERL